MMGKWINLKLSLKALSIYRNILNDVVIKRLLELLEKCEDSNKPSHERLEDFINAYGEFYYTLVSQSGLQAFKHYVTKLVICDENIFSQLSEKVLFDELNERLVSTAYSDLKALKSVAFISSKDLKQAMIGKIGQAEVLNTLPEWEFVDEMDDQTCEERFDVKYLANYYHRNGVGIYAEYQGFVWERIDGKGHLKGLSSIDPIRFYDLIGYELERQIIIDNTLHFLNGHPANNLLLYGDRGTGKSSTVKALLNEYHGLGLRIIEIPKAYLTDLLDVIRSIQDKKQKFILFVDDLAFEDNEESYTALKAILEGGLQCRPSNIVIYATSNRRHLIKEKFSERVGLMSGNYEDEVRATDTLQEKLSLADRFGITVTFSAPDKNAFLEIVDGIVRNRQLSIDKEKLHREALIWEMRYNGRSPRTAKQFVDWLEGNLLLVK